MERITHSNSPYTFLQQRLQYVQSHPGRSWTVLVENVPQWPSYPFTKEDFDQSFTTSYGPCNGYSNLIEAIASRENSAYDLQLTSDQLLVTNGALHGLSLIFRTLHQPGAIALCQGPLLASIADMLYAYGYRIVFFSTNDGEIDWEDFAQQCNKHVRLVYINSPHNPTGAICSKNTMRKLSEFTTERQITLVVDQVYDSFVFDGTPTSSPLAHNDTWSYTYTVNSMSKSFGAPGLRIGWVSSDTANIAKLGGGLERECISVCGWAQQQALRLLRLGNHSLVESVSEGAKFLVQELPSYLPNIEFSVPSGGTQFFIRLPVDDIEAFADYIMVDQGLVLTTCSNYAGLKDSFVRIPMGYPIPVVKYGLSLLSESLACFQ